MERETETLIRELQQQKPAACQWLFTTYGPAVYRMVQRIVTCREDAEEVYQDVFFKALRSIGGFDSRQASLATWLKSIAYHYVVELYDSGSVWCQSVGGCRRCTSGRADHSSAGAGAGTAATP